MTIGFICGTPMFPKSDENHIVYIVVYEVAIYLTFVDNITTKKIFLLFKLIAPFPNKKT
jgi:hypothetical protein